MTDDSVLLRPS